ncbi:MAG: hypothetical protein Q8M92_02015, partial [Candidatus Subteraquimicrobiales bacterium]|nr:hypothetical protein [Candidatus Subteraquimicrobiales bacterium]
MKICQKCGFKNEESTSDCVKCGEEIKESSEVDLTISFPQLIEGESRVKVEVLPGEAAVLVVTKGPVIG